MRLAVLLLALFYAVFYTWSYTATQSASMDAAGRGMALGFLMLEGMIAAAFTVPALILTALNKAPKWALGLALTPLGIVFLAMAAGVI